MAGAAFRRLVAAFEIALHVVAQQTDRGVEQRGIHRAALAGLAAFDQCGKDAGEGIDAGRLVDR